ncbi:MAG: DUF4956 domain-containing protein [Clostridia bacterium]|nr:DUF4956 domain-containing protein [Clostridia bacterium]
MPETIFTGLFDGIGSSVIDIGDFLLCIAVSLILGLITSLAYTYKSKYTKSFLITLALLPAVVCVVILMVNGNIGAGVAVAGAFSLVRFRSAPGSAREIVALFLAMGTGIVTGMGYLAFASLFTLIMCLALIVYSRFTSGKRGTVSGARTLKITIPEDLDYTSAFDDIFEDLTSEHELIKVKTTNMGSMFRLTYDITLKSPREEKELIDRIRTRNGNLEILLSRQETDSGAL